LIVVLLLKTNNNVRLTATAMPVGVSTTAKATHSNAVATIAAGETSQINHHIQLPLIT